MEVTKIDEAFKRVKVACDSAASIAANQHGIHAADYIVQLKNDLTTISEALKEAYESPQIEDEDGNNESTRPSSEPIPAEVGE